MSEFLIIFHFEIADFAMNFREIGDIMQDFCEKCYMLKVVRSQKLHHPSVSSKIQEQVESLEEQKEHLFG